MTSYHNLKNFLLSVEKPIRYVDGEYNVVQKSHQGRVTFLLLFPDVYEVGMSNYGMRVLYHVINSHPHGVCERAFLPWNDMRAIMEREGIPLYSLETKTPAKNFDIVGISLQSELSYTNALLMLSLSQISLRSKDRTDKDPIVIAGGPCTVNPSPILPFFDAFVVGDGEEVVREIVDAILENKGKKREHKLEALSKIKGVFVPGLSEKVRRRWIKKLTEKDVPYPPLVPIGDVVHDRLVVEVARGCTRGCRFCQAGFINRPTRFRSVDDVVRIAERSVRASGWEEVSLLSFSISDYPYFDELLRRLNQVLEKRKVGISLPSMRGETFTPERGSLLKQIKKTGLTFAVETASKRLRRVINKDYPLDTIKTAVSAAIEKGWRRVKLYYMVGLPTETLHDVEESVDFLMDIYKIKKGISYTVHLSPFIPKAFTPFQWAEFKNLDYLKKAIDLFGEKKRRNIALRFNAPEVAMIEAILARGDDKLAILLEDVYKDGGVYQDWSKYFDINIWESNFNKLGIDPADYLKEKNIEEQLPWDFVDIGVSKEYLKKEYKKAVQEETTPDCITLRCVGCMGCDGKIVVPSPPEIKVTSERNTKRMKRKIAKKFLVRVKYSLGGAFRYAGHLDVVRTIYRILRRSELPIAYTEGFSPKPKISFGPPLPVGATSKAEYMDITMTQYYTGNIVRDISPYLPENMRVIDSTPIFRKVDSLSNSINLIHYEFDLPFSIEHFYLKDKVQEYPFIYDLEFFDKKVNFFFKPGYKVNIYKAIGILLNIDDNEARQIPITRIEMYIYKDKKLFNPMGIL